MQWRNMKDAASRLPGKRSAQFVRNEIRAGRLRGARVGREWVTSDEWIDEHIVERATPVPIHVRRRA